MWIRKKTLYATLLFTAVVLAGCPETPADDDASSPPSTPEPSSTPDTVLSPTALPCQDTPCPDNCPEATPTEPDADGDRYTVSEDCDDNEPLVNPGRPETPYDGLDNDCDPTTPDDDLDGDGAPVATDCDDEDPEAAPGLTEVCDLKDNDCNGLIDDNAGAWWYLDADGDGYGDADQAVLDCDGYLRYVSDDSDCDDLEPSVYPGADEVCDGLDNDCDGSTDEDLLTTYYADADGDGHGDPNTPIEACSQPWYASETSDDCDDTASAIHPGAGEVCNGMDDDCDTLVDDSDDDVQGTQIFFTDADGDDYGDPNRPVAACSQPDGTVRSATDCNDTDGAVHPEALEVCNGYDDDCDGLVDDADPELTDGVLFFADVDGDGYGDPSVIVSACSAPDGMVDNGTDCDDTDETRNPETVWYLDADGDGFGGDSTTTQCVRPFGYVATPGDCDDDAPAVNPDADEVCNGYDDDCDTLVDDADDSLTGADTFYADTDGDGYGDPANSMTACLPTMGFVLNAEDCDDANGDISPDGTEQWYDDVDSDCDGVLDPDACVDPPPMTVIDMDDTCTYAPDVGSFNPVTQWIMTTFDDYADYKKIYSSPMVGQFTDDNGDGAIDSLDTPDIVITASHLNEYEAGVTRLISGDGSTVHWTAYDLTWNGDTYYTYRYSGVALGDIDLDGEPEIAITAVRSGACYPAALDRHGNLEWVHTGHTIGCRSNMPAIHDLEGDGDVEVVFGRLILNGADGSLQGKGSGGSGYNPDYSNSGYHAFGIDLDGDGTMEVVAGSSLYNPDGETICSTGYADGYPAAADLDGDGLGEFVVTGNGYVRVFENDCSYITGWSLLGGGWGGPPTIADFDGDGAREIGVAGTSKYVVYETNGAILWSMPVTDESSNSTGSSVFDFDGNGAAEVVYGDEVRLWIFDGTTGQVLLEDPTHASGTINEYPTIADFDGDGKAEIAVVNSREDGGLYVVGDADDNWVSARQVWNQQAYYITNVNDDLSIPQHTTPNWPDYNSFRQGAPGSFDPTAAPNLYPVVYPPCAGACGSQVALMVQLANDGLIRAAGDLVVAVYGETEDGTRSELEALTIEEPVEPGTLSSAFTFTLDQSEVAGYARLVVMVDANEVFNECNEADNEVAVTL